MGSSNLNKFLNIKVVEINKCNCLERLEQLYNETKANQTKGADLEPLLIRYAIDGYKKYISKCKK